MSQIMRDRAPANRPVTLRGWLNWLTTRRAAVPANCYGVLCARRLP